MFLNRLRRKTGGLENHFAMLDGFVRIDRLSSSLPFGRRGE
jgi:hypothetical protein